MTAERHTLFFHRGFFSIIYYFVHHVLPFYIFILQGSRATLGDFAALFSTYARGLPRSLSDHSSGTSSLASNLRSGTASITLRPQLGDFVARFSTYARGLPRSLSDHSLGISSLAPRPVLGDCLDHSPTTARGLRRSLLDLCMGTASITLRS